MTSVLPISVGVRSLLPSRFHSASPKRLGNGRQRASTLIRAMGNDGKREKRRDSKLVDENMIVLKMRIREMEMKEIEKHLEKEKDWYENYDSDVYELVGLLQILMMNNRPSLVLGVVALLVISSSTSIALVLSSLLHIFM
ncbi:hypothetical protein AAHA92_14290 [Salvia divinorum]|uniref:Uncharacterized protein n=1 Tax=Salvia divinorum TaxID=28513 RepID=A0ABD1HCE8_SALDI